MPRVMGPKRARRAGHMTHAIERFATVGRDAGWREALWCLTVGPPRARRCFYPMLNREVCTGLTTRVRERENQLGKTT